MRHIHIRIQAVHNSPLPLGKECKLVHAKLQVEAKGTLESVFTASFANIIFPPTKLILVGWHLEYELILPVIKKYWLSAGNKNKIKKVSTYFYCKCIRNINKQFYDQTISQVPPVLFWLKSCIICYKFFFIW